MTLSIDPVTVCVIGKVKDISHQYEQYSPDALRWVGFGQ